MIKPGELRAHGILFLRARPYFARTSGGEQQVILRLLERRATGTTNLTAVWTGPAADSFVAQHGDTLKPGCALELTLTRMRVHDNELHGVIYAASHAPARWEAHAANDSAPAPAPADAPDTPATDSIAPQPATARAGA